MNPELIHDVQALRRRVDAARREGLVVGFVPTMGALHAGHLSLIEAAASKADLVIVSVFVNPTQFGPNEDLDTYPRTLKADFDGAVAAGAHLVFAPDVETMYPGGVDANRTWIEVHELTENLCGRYRPGHFRGVTTIVARLFHLVRPDLAVFGQKDYQQLAVIRRMVKDLVMGVEILAGPTVREPDGLAMSSRNLRLSEIGRRDALTLVRALRAAHDAASEGEEDPDTLVKRATACFDETPGATLQYLELVDGVSLEPLSATLGETPVMAIAAFVEGVRLIDNVGLKSERP